MSDLTEKIFIGIGASVAIVILVAGIGILVAFPIKWTWNTTMPYLFSLPTITWGKAWCLHFLAASLIKSTASHSK